MDRKSLRIFVILPVLLAVALTGCKKDEDDDRLSMSGDLNFDFPSYAVVGQKVESYVSGITTPSGSDLEYFWVSSDIELDGTDTDTLTGQAVSMTLPDEPGLYSITAYARSKSGEYYSRSRTSSVQVITTDAGGVAGWTPSTQSITDERDGQEYQYRRYGNLDWFTQNLLYDGAHDGLTLGRPYDDSEGIDRIFGRLYSWQDATLGESGSGLGGGPQGACPEGWSVPTVEDWEDLALAVGETEVDFYDHWDGIGEILSAPITVNESAMWPYSPDNLHTNTAGWNGFPTGNSRDNYGEYENIASYGMWWASSEMENGMVPYRFIYYNTDTFDVYYTDKTSYGVSVRCVRLAQEQ